MVSLIGAVVDKVGDYLIKGFGVGGGGGDGGRGGVSDNGVL